MDAGIATLQRSARRSSWIDRLLRQRVLDLVRGLQDGALLLREGGHELWSAPASAVQPGETLRACVRVHDPAFYRRVALNGSVGAAEGYMDGLWDCDDLVALVRILVRNRERLDAMERGPARLGGRRDARLGCAAAQYPRRQPAQYRRALRSGERVLSACSSTTT